MLGLLFPILLLAMGVYVLVGAIRGSGKLFSTENFKDDCVDKGKKYLRILYFCLAGIMLIMALSNAIQYSLYTNRVIHYSMTEDYKKDFKDVLDAHTDENGMFSYTIKQNVSNGFSCIGGTATVTEKTYDNIDPNSEDLTAEHASVLLQAAMDAHPSNFPQSNAAMSCSGGAAENPAKKYYIEKPLEDENGNAVYTSSFKGIRSDAEEPSFTKTLYETFRPTLLNIINYVCIGLVVVGLALVFVLTSKFTDKEKVAKARSSYASGGTSMPSSAFNFDDEKKEN